MYHIFLKPIPFLTHIHKIHVLLFFPILSQCIHMEGHLSFPPGVLQGRPQGVFSPSSAGLTHSPVQILGRELIVCGYS